MNIQDHPDFNTLSENDKKEIITFKLYLDKIKDLESSGLSKKDAMLKANIEIYGNKNAE